MLKCTVSELNNKIRNVYNDKICKDIKLTGEIYSVNSSGNTYWVGLKDDSSVMSCAFFNTSKFEYKEGEKVEVGGYVQFFTKGCRTTFIAKNIKRIGEGEIHKQYKKNYQFLESNGYFDNANKPMPEKIESIGILTAKSGDAINDVVRALRDNDYKGKVYIYNCNVQGRNCPKSVADGIKYFNDSDIDIDVLLLTRGGGSQVDLMGFSDIDVVGGG